MFKASFLDSFSKKYYNSFLLVFGVSILGVSDNILLMLSENIGLAQFHFIRSVISICFIIFLSRLTGLSIKYKNLRAVFIRSIFIVISMVIFFGTLPIVSAAGAGAEVQRLRAHLPLSMSATAGGSQLRASAHARACAPFHTLFLSVPCPDPTLNTPSRQLVNTNLTANIT